MTAPRIIPLDVQARQVQASDPAASAFVSANAGSGKTHVLVQRVIRLLLEGTAPEKILCITFTKAAAANMAERVFETLGHWITLDDAALDHAIREVGAVPDAVRRRRARELFASALETPGGLKVQTIHALCTRLLQQFPFEANVPAHFSILDDRDQNELMERASLKVLLEAAMTPNSLQGCALATAMTSAADVTFRDVVREAVLNRDHFQAWVQQAGNLDTAIAQLSRTLGVAASENIKDIERDIVDGPHLPREAWVAVAEQFSAGAKSDNAQAARLGAALAQSRSEQVQRYLEVFLTGTGEVRKSLLTTALARQQPTLAMLLNREMPRVLALLQKHRAAVMRDRTQALLVIASAVADHYRRAKQERGLLDYDDLIEKTLAMLDRTASSWVHFKLDQGIDHVLIDEAQDTSPRQWDIVEHIVSEFTAGVGARGHATRTLFAVGDEKQSIFSFQGAAPREFDLRRRHFKSRFAAAQLKFTPVSFTSSFRSGIAILRAVQSTFQAPHIYRSITSDRDGMPPHLPLADAAPDMVELWELQEPDERPDLEGWRAPFDAVAETSPEVRLAQRIRDTIRTLMDERTTTGIASRRRLLRHGNILVLVRRRGKAFNAIIQALKQANIPVAGADRLKLTEHIAIIDLMNLADALLFRRDDLALAVALKSPLFGLNDDDLFKLAWGRKGTLRDALVLQAQKTNQLNDKFLVAQRRLDAYEAKVLQDTPFGFFSWLLGGDGGRKRILKRLGPEATDALDEFLELALNHERRTASSLQGFMTWLRSADTEVKRDMEISRNEVRVMTVHGAKGLEAPIVFLADTTSSPTDTQRINLIRLADDATGGSPCMVWAGRKADDPPSVVKARAAMTEEAEDEYRRLLYVAMTRAAERLIVGGCRPGNRNEVRQNSWYDLIKKGLDASGLAIETVSTQHGQIRRYTRGDVVHLAAAANTDGNTRAFSSEVDAGSREENAFVLPSWLRTSPPREAHLIRLLRPSESSSDEGYEVRSGESVVQRARALKRGGLVHRLLQFLPDIAVDRRRETALNYLARNAEDWPTDEQVALVEQVMMLIAAERFAAVFGPTSRAEVSLVGRLKRPGGKPILVSGQIDRLVVTTDEILIVDYKTNHDPPANAAATPVSYLRQLALYRALLMQLHPVKPVRAALLWTERPEMMEISGTLLDAELTRAITL